MLCLSSSLSSSSLLASRALLTDQYLSTLSSVNSSSFLEDEPPPPPPDAPADILLPRFALTLPIAASLVDKLCITTLAASLCLKIPFNPGISAN